MANEMLFASSLDLLKESFLWAAAKGGNIQDCESLIEIGSDINWRGHGGDTPLLAACRCGHSETVAFLLARGADITAVGTDSYNALHISSDKNDIATLNALLDAGMTTKSKTRNGLTAFDIAKEKNHDNICNRLMRTIRTRVSATLSGDDSLHFNSHSSHNSPHNNNNPHNSHNPHNTHSNIHTSSSFNSGSSSSSAANISLPSVNDDGMRSTASSLRNLTRSMFICSNRGSNDAAEEGYNDNGNGGNGDRGVSGAHGDSLDHDGVNPFSRNYNINNGNNITTGNSGVSGVGGNDVEVVRSSDLNEYDNNIVGRRQSDGTNLPLLRAINNPYSANNQNNANNTNANSNLRNNANNGICNSINLDNNERIHDKKSGATATTVTNTQNNQNNNNTNNQNNQNNQKNKNQNYSIIGQTNSGSGSGSPGAGGEFFNETVIALRKLLDTEQRERKVSDAMIIQMKAKNVEILSELTSNMDDYKALQDKSDLQIDLLGQFTGSISSLEKLDLYQIVELEKQLRVSLQCVEERKAVLLREQLDFQKEQRLCVICQEKEKSVVLLPCRHMCLCDDCSDTNKVQCCPLCRHPIAHKISVYA